MCKSGIRKMKEFLADVFSFFVKQETKIFLLVVQVVVEGQRVGIQEEKRFKWSGEIQEFLCGDQKNKITSEMEQYFQVVFIDLDLMVEPFWPVMTLPIRGWLLRYSAENTFGDGIHPAFVLCYVESAGRIKRWRGKGVHVWANVFLK